MITRQQACKCLPKWALPHKFCLGMCVRDTWLCTWHMVVYMTHGCVCLHVMTIFYVCFVRYKWYWRCSESKPRSKHQVVCDTPSWAFFKSSLLLWVVFLCMQCLNIKSCVTPNRAFFQERLIDRQHNVCVGGLSGSWTLISEKCCPWQHLGIVTCHSDWV